jgi:FtsP/CotA-like multicopper oxidase with cupredoxin domain
MPFWQIGTEAGFLPDAPVQLTNLLLGPAERADVIVDFSNVPAGTNIIMQNVGPDSPFGGFPIAPADLADPDTTGQVMEFRVTDRKSADVSTPPEFLRLPSITHLTGGNARPLALLEMMSMNFEDAPVAAMLGIIDSSGQPVHKMWSEPITENPAVGATEVWEFYNFTADAHPIHIHEIHFQVVNRQAFDPIAVAPTGDPRPPESWETGYKETVIAYPGEVTRVRGKFEIPGLFVWHCHIVEHEDNEMMRPYAIGDIPVPTEP